MASHLTSAPSDREILEALVETTTRLAQAIKLADSRRSDDDRIWRAQLAASLAEFRDALIALLEGTHEQKATTAVALKREPSGLQLTLGDGTEENTTRVQLAAPHWARVRPIVLWLASSVATAVGLGKLFAFLNGAP